MLQLISKINLEKLVQLNHEVINNINHILFVSKKFKVSLFWSIWSNSE